MLFSDCRRVFCFLATGEYSTPWLQEHSVSWPLRRVFSSPDTMEYSIPRIMKSILWPNYRGELGSRLVVNIPCPRTRRFLCALNYYCRVCYVPQASGSVVNAVTTRPVSILYLRLAEGIWFADWLRVSVPQTVWEYPVRQITVEHSVPPRMGRRVLCPRPARSILFPGGGDKSPGRAPLCRCILHAGTLTALRDFPSTFAFPFLL